MKKILFLGMSVLLLTATGCATKTFVLQQTDPINKKIGDLDSRLSALEYKIDHLPAPSLSPTDKDALQKALDGAQKAQDSANAAADSAKKAEDAANAAQTAAQKGNKILELEQKK